MERWVPAADFIEADVIRWVEGVFDRPRRGKKASRIGERRVAGQVKSIVDGWVRLQILACEIMQDKYAGQPMPKLAIKGEVKRAKKTILRGSPERLFWPDDDTARAAVVESLAEAGAAEP